MIFNHNCMNVSDYDADEMKRVFDKSYFKEMEIIGNL